WGIPEMTGCATMASSGMTKAAWPNDFQGRSMRLVAPRNVDAHTLRVERLRRDRAASKSLRVAFPAIQQLHLELKFAGTTANSPGAQSHVMHPPARAYFMFPCPYANCDGQ